MSAIPRRRVAEKLDEDMNRRDYAGAERHLRYWLEEARLTGDGGGELFVLGELAGFYRKTARREQALETAERALALLDARGEGGIGAGTALVNAATVFGAFGEHPRALALFARARALYEAAPDAADTLLGGLYNNMAASCAALGRCDEAAALYERALAFVPEDAPERAVACLNLADALAAAGGAPARVAALLDEAYAALRDTPVPRDGAYAFVCERCADGFAHHGRSAAAAELARTAKEIYERA